jgi:hypothetical protein
MAERGARALPKKQKAPRSRKAPKAQRLPKPPKKLHEQGRFIRFPAPLAVVIAGVLAGLVAAALYYSAVQGCHWLRGPGGCGGIGLLSTIVTLVISGAAGAGVLRLMGQRDAVATSYLGIALLAVLVMVTVIRQLDNVWMVAITPAMTAGCFLISWWLISIVITEES